ncbi:hypothetical protein TNCV_1624361 [Trichonephila clavipes]|nr:hypothetical protein TNCV_1624361 [Trichonephila clavipes]
MPQQLMLDDTFSEPPHKSTLSSHSSFQQIRTVFVKRKSANFVFFMNALPDRFLSATDPVSRNRCTESVVLFHLDISAEMHLSHGNEILQRNKIPRWLLALGKTSCTSCCAQLTSILKLIRSKLLMMGSLLPSCERNLNQHFWFLSNKDYRVDVRDFGNTRYVMGLCSSSFFDQL